MLDSTTLAEAVQEAEATLQMVGITKAALDAKIACSKLPVVWAVERVNRMAGNAPVQWTLGWKYYTPNRAMPFLAVLQSNGVAVWRCDSQGYVDTFLGIVTPTEED